jgi:hypothetical protein
MTLASPVGKMSITGRPDFAQLVGKAPALPKDPAPFYSGAGPISFSLPGGKVGPVSGTFTMPAVPTWTNRDQITTVDRSRPLTVTWTGVDDSSMVLIVGRSSDVPHGVHGLFLCAAGAADGAFTVPQYVLAALPAGVSATSVPAAEVWVGAAAVLNPQSFSASGLDAGFIIPSAFSARTVVMR